jgi:phage recombination protein Bet
MHVCKRTGLDPFIKQIHPVPRWDSKLGRNAITFQVGIDGFRLIADRTGKYAPGREPTFTHDESGNLISATAYVKKLTADGTWHEVAATAFYNEYVQRKKDGRPNPMWEAMKYSQLAKCAESLSIRKAFPADLSGIYSVEEMKQADVEVIEEVKPLITIEQVQELDDMIGEDTVYRKRFMQHLLKSKKITCLEHMPVDMFDGALNSAKANHEANIRKMEQNKEEIA